MESDDEDVLFENSVLHQALLDCGITDLETEPRKTAVQVQENNGDCLREANHSHVNHTKDKTNCFNSLAYFFCSYEEIMQWHRHFRYQTLCRLVSSPLLAEEDKSFLKYFVEEEEPCKDLTYTKRLLSVPLIGILLLTFVSINLIGVPLLVSPWITLFLSFVIPYTCLQPYSFWFSFIFVNVLVLIMYGVTWNAIVSSIKSKVLTQLKDQDEFIKNAEAIAWELMYLEKKCMRLVQESELVARGFTFATHHHVASRIRRGLTEITDQLCPQLREVMLTENIALMAELKKCVVKMMRNLPMICNDSDFSTLDRLSLDQESCSYLDNSDPSSVQENVMTNKEDKSEGTNNEAQISTDGYQDNLRADVIPLAKLSKSVAILHIYISGFMRRLALCFYVHNFKDKSIDPYMATAECVENSIKAFHRAKSALTQSHTFYRAIHLSGSEKGCAKMNRPRPTSELHNIYTHLNNLDLQLSHLTRRFRGLVIAIEIHIEAESKSNMNLDSATALTSDNPMDKNTIIDTLQQVKETLDICQACYEEAVTHLHRRSELEAQRTQTRPVTNQITPTKPSLSDVRIVPHVDHIIQDEVFEALTASREDDHADYVRRRPLSEESKAKVSLQKENMKKLKQELETVVKKIGITHRQREARALARSKGILDEVATVAQHDQDAAAYLDQSIKDQVNADALARGCAFEDGTPVMGDGDGPSSVSAEDLDMNHPRRPLPVPFPYLNDLDERAHSQLFISKPLQVGPGSELNSSFLPSSLNAGNGDENSKPAGGFYDVDISSQSSCEANSKSITANSESIHEELVLKKNLKKSALEFDLAMNDVSRLDRPLWKACKSVLHIPADASSSSSIPRTHSSSTGAQSMDSDHLTDHLEMSGEFNPLGGVLVGGEVSKLSETAGGPLPSSSSSSSSGLLSSQIKCPLHADPETEGFRNIGGSYLSRYNFTAREREMNLYHAQMDYTSLTEHEASRATGGQCSHGLWNSTLTQDIDSDPNEWVKISQRQVTTADGSKIDILRQKTVHVGDTQAPAVSSSDSQSHFSKSLALLAAEKAKGMGIPGQHEEKFGESSDEDTLY